MESEEKILGLIAGGGSLPVELVRHAHEHGIEKIVSAGIKEHTDPEVAQKSYVYENLKIGELGRLIKLFKKNRVRKAVMLGRVPPKFAVADIPLDFRLIRLAAKIIDRRADGILGAIAEELARDEIILMDTTRYLSHLLTPEGVLTKKAPDAKQKIDIEFGIKIAMSLGEHDIGQTAVVHKHAVIAAEAMEGTDECIKRAGKYSKNTVVVKMSKPKQDLRFDVPCAGIDTVNSMIEANASVLAVEAGKSFLLDKESMIEKANSHGIIIVGVKADKSFSKHK